MHMHMHMHMYAADALLFVLGRPGLTWAQLPFLKLTNQQQDSAFCILVVWVAQNRQTPLKSWRDASEFWFEAQAFRSKVLPF